MPGNHANWPNSNRESLRQASPEHPKMCELLVIGQGAATRVSQSRPRQELFIGCVYNRKMLKNSTLLRQRTGLVCHLLQCNTYAAIENDDMIILITRHYDKMNFINR